MTYAEETSQKIVGKTIAKAEITGHGVDLTFTDGTMLDYCASDGGYSSWSVRRSATKRDPDWKDICAKCKDGDIEPEHCEYYGEPNGCNSPIYGEHPTAKKSLAVGNTAKLREALGKLRAELWNNPVIAGKRKFELYEIADAALAAPPRNCDLYADERSAWEAFSEKRQGPDSSTEEYEQWLFEKATA